MSPNIVRDAALRIERLLELHKSHPEWPEERIISEMVVDWGIQERTIKKYIEHLKRAERW
jgi:hypothetical protein